jgi:hypothetical protein
VRIQHLFFNTLQVRIQRLFFNTLRVRIQRLVFKAAANIGDEALLVMKVETMKEYIGINFVDIIQ